MDITQIGTDLGTLVLLPVVRSVAGWGVKALEDNKVTKFELKQLAGTVLRVGAIGLVAHFGLNAAGFDIPALASACGSFLIDKIFSAMKK